MNILSHVKRSHKSLLGAHILVDEIEGNAEIVFGPHFASAHVRSIRGVATTRSNAVGVPTAYFPPVSQT